MNRREPKITPSIARLTPKEAAKALSVSEERAKELLEAARRASLAGRRPKAAQPQGRAAEAKRITFYGPLG
ncbi:MAG: hypothetical protein HW397_459 [Dehalococcoidia bacterium]|nr:hypothetical protein [Dehalococcoidia bacterium]